MKKNLLFNVSRLVNDKNDTPIEVSFLSDMDYTIRKMNAFEPHYYWKKIMWNDPRYFGENRPNVFLVDELKEPCEDLAYSNKHLICKFDNDECYVCLYDDGKPSTYFKPSSMHCMRNMYYQATSAQPDAQSTKTGEFYGICESGTDRHLRIQEYISSMRKYGVQCDYIDVETYINENIDKVDNLKNLKVIRKERYETKLLDEEKNLTFLCDGIIRYKGKLYVLEIKTEMSWKWGNRECVDDSHKIQASTYAVELGIDDVMFIYENRDLCSKKCYIFTPNDEQKKLVIDRISNCKQHIADGKVPQKDESLPKKICEYCEYKTLCKLEDCT